MLLTNSFCRLCNTWNFHTCRGFPRPAEMNGLRKFTSVGLVSFILHSWSYGIDLKSSYLEQSNILGYVVYRSTTYERLPLRTRKTVREGTVELLFYVLWKVRTHTVLFFPVFKREIFDSRTSRKFFTDDVAGMNVYFIAQFILHRQFRECGWSSHE